MGDSQAEGTTKDISPIFDERLHLTLRSSLKYTKSEETANLPNYQSHMTIIKYCMSILQLLRVTTTS